MKLGIKQLKLALVFLLIILSSGASVVATDDGFLVGFFFFTAFIAFVTGVFNKIFKEALIIAAAIIAILIYYYVANGDTDIYTWIGFLLKVFTGFLIARINGEAFIRNLI